MELKDRVIHVDGSVVGFQFNKHSMGSRTIKHRTVKLSTSDANFGTVYLSILAREVRVCRLVEGQDWHWIATK